MASSININQNNNVVTLQDNNGSLSITNNNTGTTVNVTQPVTNVVAVATPGPQGQQGPIGPIPTSGSFTGSFSGSFTGSLQGTASYALTASYLEGYISPFPFTGSAIISGSLDVTGSISSTAGFSGSFSGSFQGNGSGLTNIPASGITGLNLSQIATGSVSASVSLGTGSFTVTSGSSTFMFVSSSGNVGFGTTTPAYKVDVSGSARISTDFNVGSTTFTSTSTPNFISLGATYGDGTDYGPKLKLLDSGATQWGIGISAATGINSYGTTHNFYHGSGTTAIQLFSTTDSSTTSPHYISLGQSYSSVAGSNPKLRLFGTSYGIGVSSGQVDYIAPKHVFYTGNVLLNTATDAGYRLDVNGTARVSGAMTVGSSVITGNFGNLTLSNNGVAGVSLTFTNSEWGSPNPAIFGTIGLHAHASSQVEIKSTTRGFLPPRMTLAQRVAIS
jgi:hypothetical protein